MESKHDVRPSEGKLGFLDGRRNRRSLTRRGLTRLGLLVAAAVLAAVAVPLAALKAAGPEKPQAAKSDVADPNAPATQPVSRPETRQMNSRWEKLSVSFDGQTADVDVQRFDPPLLIKPVELDRASRATPLDAAVSIISHWSFGKTEDDFRKCADHMLDPNGFLTLRRNLDRGEYFAAHRKGMEAGVYVLALIRHAGGVLVVNWLPSMRSIPTGNGEFVGAWRMAERQGSWCMDDTGKLSSPLTEHLARTGYALVRETETSDIRDYRELSKVLDAAKPQQVWWVVAYAPSASRLASPKGYKAANDSMEFHFIAHGQPDIYDPAAVLWVMKPGYEALPISGADQRAKELSRWRGRRVFVWSGNDTWPHMQSDITGILLATDAPSGTGGLDAMFANLKSEDHYLRFRTAGVLGLMGNRLAVPPLIAALKDARWDVRGNVAEALGRLCDPRAVEPLIAILRDKDAGYKAAEALGNIGYRRAAGPLMETIVFLRGKTPLVGGEGNTIREAVWALGKVADEKAIAFLVEILRNSKSGYREPAARALALASDLGFGQLMTLLDDEDASIRRLAAQALGTTGVAGGLAIRKLETVAKQDSDSRVREAAEVAVKRIRRAFATTTSPPASQATTQPTPSASSGPSTQPGRTNLDANSLKVGL
jgi:HEAT repeat protein